MKKQIKIVEVGPRDGLQNEKEILTVAQRKKYIELLMTAGHKYIEVGAFVRAEKIPQMQGTDLLFKELFALPLSKRAGIDFSALVPNAKGFEQAVEAGVKSIVVFTAASESFNMKNINASIQESLDRFKDFIPQAKKLKMRVRGYVSTCFGCPYEGDVPEKRVLQVTEKLLALGVSEVSFGDTIGVANPKQVKSLSKKLITLAGVSKIALHFHDTRGTALANILEGLESGIQIFDASSAGLGGCPYAPGAAGNVATEDVLYMVHGMGYKTGVDLGLNVDASRYMEACLQRSLPSKYLQAALSAEKA